MTRPFRTLVLLLALAGALGGCGNRHEVVTEAHVEGIYLDVGELDYQIQISRYLNPNEEPDASYLKGLPEYVSPLAKDETWFGIFLRVANQTEQPHESADDIKIVDPDGNEFEPVPLDPERNVFAYSSREVAPGGLIPEPDSAGSYNTAQGALLLFKLPYATLQNRPLELHIGSDEGEGTIDIDL